MNGALFSMSTVVVVERLLSYKPLFLLMFPLTTHQTHGESQAKKESNGKNVLHCWNT